MNELTTIQAILYGVSGILLYCIGILIGMLWSEYRYQHPKQPHRKRKNSQPEGLGFNPNNPMNYNCVSAPAPVGYESERVTDRYGNVWYVRK